jgi:hypothetical protein
MADLNCAAMQRSFVPALQTLATELPETFAQLMENMSRGFVKEGLPCASLDEFWSLCRSIRVDEDEDYCALNPQAADSQIKWITVTELVRDPYLKVWFDRIGGLIPNLLDLCLEYLG